jgi:threonine/homoserine/homoserine lactone efflux protein
MTSDFLLGLCGFALVSAITPGPNNLMLMASGANFGLRRSLPHMLGIGLGFPAMLLLIGLGIMRLFEALPLLRVTLTMASVAYLLWLALKIARAGAPEASTESVRPLSFLQAAGFQWINPKAWAMGLSAMTLYAPGREPWAVLWVALAFCAVSLVSTTTWTVIGREIRRLLGKPARLRAFNWTMAALLVASMLPVLLR